jgi:cysteinyl-tRNA synthetase
MTRKKEEFTPMDPHSVRVYVCGPTVYDLLHIGNARPMVTFDTLRRFLLSKGLEVNYVQNFTDIEDKIIRRGSELGLTPGEVAERYIQEAKTDAKGLNCLEPTAAPRVTQEMNAIIEMIQTLLDKGYAYQAGGEVFFSSARFERYGKLSGKNLDDLTAGARVEINKNKKEPLDFVLWKPAKPGEPQWESPWGAGRPGWHIECSVMAKKYLGDTFDIHAGGEDLIFPHHENEIAQSEAANGATFARYWMHVRYIQIDDQKMSKSLGNFLTIRESAEKFSYEAIRFFILSAHYRSPINFSDEQLKAAQSALERIRNCAGLLRHAAQNHPSREWLPGENEALSQLKKLQKDFEEKLEDDLNTADAMAALFEMVRYANIQVNAEASQKCAEVFGETIRQCCDILGFTIDRTPENSAEEIESLIARRREARENKDWTAADKLRDELRRRGVILEDRKDGTVRWSYQ